MSVGKLTKNHSNTIREILQIYRYMVHNDLHELDWQEDNFRITIRRRGGKACSRRRYGVESHRPSTEKELPNLTENLPREVITSPLVGVFYSSPLPDAPPFVKEGDIISAGQTVCIVEAMKLMNEIQAETKCKIIKVLVQNGQSVQAGQPLFVVSPLQE